MLTDKRIKALKATATAYEVSDGRGLSLRVLPSGTRTWALRYRVGKGFRRVSLGEYGTGKDQLTLKAARDRAEDERSEVRRGGDPSRERREQREAATVAALAERFLSEHVEAKRKASTLAGYRTVLSKHILPRIGNLRAVDVDREHVSSLHYSMRSIPTQANRALAILSKMLNLAERWGIRPDGSNPCRHVERYPENASERFLSPAELARLGEALRAAEGEEHPSAILAIRLLALTGMRRNEVLSLRWSEIDLERGVATLADSKTGRKVVRLPAPALELLSRTKRQEGNPFVCYGQKRTGRLVGLQRPWSRIRAAAGLEDVRLHDLRHSHAAVGAGLGLGLPIIGKLLGHSQAATTQRYAHLGDDPLREAAERVGGEIAAALAGDSAEVVPFGGRR